MGFEQVTTEDVLHQTAISFIALYSVQFSEILLDNPWKRSGLARTGTYLEVAVFVHVSTGEATDVGYGGHVAVRVGEEEDVYTAACRYTLLPQCAVELCLWCQYRLKY